MPGASRRSPMTGSKAKEAADLARKKGREKGFDLLLDEVVAKGLCTGCGACATVCPRCEIDFSAEGWPVLQDTDDCVKCALCAVHCPSSFSIAEIVEEKMFSGERDELGYYIRRFSARASDPEIRQQAQDGGVTSAIVKYMFEKDMIDGAVLCKADENFVGSPFLATSWDEASQAAKSKYNICPNLVGLKKARDEGLKRVLLVGLPCHIAAYRKIEEYGPRSLSEIVVMTVGIFCSENFCRTMISEFLPQVGVEPRKIRKMDIKGLFRVETEDGVVEVPLQKMKDYVNPGCLACSDFSAELADISVGAVGAPAGWCSVLARTEKGNQLLRRMKREGVLETGKLVKPKTLKRMSASKRLRGNRKLAEILGTSGS